MDTAITTEQLRRTTFLVSIRGEIDAYTAPALRTELIAVIEDREASTVVLDLAAVTFLDSTGLGTIVGALRRLRKRNGHLVIVSPPASAARIFQHTGLDSVLDLHPSRAAALSALGD